MNWAHTNPLKALRICAVSVVCVFHLIESPFVRPIKLLLIHEFVEAFFAHIMGEYYCSAEYKMYAVHYISLSVHSMSKKLYVIVIDGTKYRIYALKFKVFQGCVTVEHAK